MRPFSIIAAFLPAAAAFISRPLSRGAMPATRASSTRSVMSMSGGKEMWVLRQGNVPKKEEWVPVVQSSEIAPGDRIPFETDGLSLLLVADQDGSVYCTAGNSPFMSYPLADGKVQDGKLFCPQSNTAFDLETGEVVGEWCPFPPFLGPLLLGKIYQPRDLAVYPVRARGNMIEVFLDRNLKAQFESKYWAGLLDAQGKATGDYY